MTDQLSTARQLTYERDGLALGYTVIGTGPAVLFIHGATATGEFEWGALAARLAPRYRCVLPDLRGHGRSGFRGLADTNGDAICADLHHLIEHADLGRPHVVGFSYGAEIALMLELMAPGTAQSLVLISPGTGRPADYRIPTVELLHRTWPFTLRKLHESRHSAEHWRLLVEALQADSATRSEVPAETLAAVDCPLLLLAGKRDERTRQAQGRRFAEVNTRAQFVPIAGAAHAAHHDRPDEVGRLVENFLSGVPSEKAGT